LYLDAEWNGLGSVDYGFLIDITTANPTAVSYQSYPEPALVATTTPLSNSDREISALLSQYGWTINHHISSHIETLPETFAHEPDVFPYAIYWAYNNELSSEIGLDITPYLGKTIKASLFHLNENLPDEFRPHTSARAVIISHNGEIIGAWIEKVAGFACSLSRKRFDEVVMQDWSEWLVSSGVVDLENKIDRELSLKTPEDIIEEYYSALNDHDFPRLISVMSRSSITYALFVNKENDALFNHWDDSSIKKSMDNIESAKLLTVAQKGHHCLPLYEAHVDLQFVNPAMMTIPEGKNLRFVVLVEEIKGLGFRIAEINTAPGVSQRLCSPRVDY
jgi:L-rhamnose mutarotase